MAKHLYIDIPQRKDQPEYKDLTRLGINDEIEVCVYELKLIELSNLMEAIEWACVRMNAKISLSFHSGHSHLGFQIFQFTQND